MVSQGGRLRVGYLWNVFCVTSKVFEVMNPFRISWSTIFEVEPIISERPKESAFRSWIRTKKKAGVSVSLRLSHA